MRRTFALGLLAAVCLVGCATPNTVQKPGYQIVKVNRTFLDLDGHETDVVGDLQGEAIYQFGLRNNPERQSGARFHVKWKAPRHTSQIRLQLEVRGLTDKNLIVQDVLTQDYPSMDGWAEWSTLDITGERYKRLGTITAWKVSVYTGGQLMAELPSGNWYGDIKPDQTIQ